MKVQIQERPPRFVTAPCDKLSMQVFGWMAEEYADILVNGAACREDKRGVVEVEYWLKLLEGYEDKLPPDARHREVLFACMELYEAGFKVVTPAMIVRHMTGSDRAVMDWEGELKPIINKLMQTLIKIDLSPLEGLKPRRKGLTYRKRFEEPKYKDYRMITSPLLPARYKESSVNGQKSVAIEMLAESPLIMVADFKRQKITYDATPLVIPARRNTLRQTVIKRWLLRRIKLADPSRQKPLNSSILFTTLYSECGLTDADKWEKQDARGFVLALLEHFKREGVMRDFEIVKSGQVYRSIKIIYR